MKLNTRFSLMAVAVSAVLACGFVLGKIAGANVRKAANSDGQSEMHAEEAGHGSGEHSDDEPTVNLDELEKLTCEHNITTVDCDECRFEIGVVKIDPAIAEPLIETGSVENVQRTKTLRLTGQVQLDRTKTVEVVPIGGGRVEQVKKFLGDVVQKGDTLAVIYSDDLGQAKAEFLEIQSRLELAEMTFNREKELYEQKISSRADYLAALNELKAAQASYAAADKRLRLFGLEAEQIKAIKGEEQNETFADLVLRAPQDGTLIAQNISLGQIVAAETVYTIADLSNLWVWCDVYEKDLAILHEQTAKDKPLKAAVKVKAFESAEFIGTVDFIGNLMDEHTRTVKVRVQVSNPERKLRPDMFADVEIAVPLDGEMLAVPQTAVMTDAGDHFVFEHWKNDLWLRRAVTVGSKYGNTVELLSGLSEGATIVTGGAFMLKSDVLREKMGAGCAD